MVNLSRHINNVNIGKTDTSHFTINLGKKRYELTNHLGNVLSVISDKPIPHDDGSGNADYWQADILSSYDYSPFGVMLTGRTFEKEETVQICHDSTTLTTLTILNETFDTWFTWTTMGSALLTYVDGGLQISNPNNSKKDIGTSKTFTTGTGVHAVSFDITDNSCANIQLWPPAIIPVPIDVKVRDNSNNVVASGSYTTAGNYNLSFTPLISGATYKIEFYMTSASAFCYFAVDNVLITYQDTDTVQVCENVSKKGKYRYAFNNMERDDQIKGRGNSYDYVHRFYDPRLGRFLSIDDLTYKFPWYSPYQFAGNKVIRCIDLDGKEELDMAVTSNPNTTSGQPGEVSLKISKHYTIVTEGEYAVPQSERIINSEFSQLYRKGNITLFVSELPSSNKDAVYLDEKNNKLAMKALKGDEEAKTKLKNMGVNYYILTVTYDYTISSDKDVTLIDAYNNMLNNPAKNGIVLMAATKLSSSSLGELRSQNPLNEQLVQGLIFGYHELSKDNEAGGAGTIDKRNSLDFIFLNPNTWNNDKKFNTLIPADPYYSTFYSRTEAVVHEAGHNSTDLGHRPGYDYDDTGLSSNKNGYVFPTENNTKQIISSQKNRSNMKVSSSPKY